jgi:hypothetical protein
MQRPLCCAQAPVIFAFVALTCFAARAGDIHAATAIAIMMRTTDFMETPPDSGSEKKLDAIALTRQASFDRHLP